MNDKYVLHCQTIALIKIDDEYYERKKELMMEGSLVRGQRLKERSDQNITTQQPQYIKSTDQDKC